MVVVVVVAVVVAAAVVVVATIVVFTPMRGNGHAIAGGYPHGSK